MNFETVFGNTLGRGKLERALTAPRQLRLTPGWLSQPLVRELFPVYRQVREHKAQVGIRYRSVTARLLGKVSIPFRLSPGCKLYYVAHGNVGTSTERHRFPILPDAASAPDHGESSMMASASCNVDGV